MAKFALFVVLLIIAGCTSPSAPLSNKAQKIQVLFVSNERLEDCKWLGHVTGSEGFWYNYIFYGNDTLIEGALNQLRNKTIDMGGDTLLLAPIQDFTTSVTYLGSVFHCDN